ASSFLIKMAPHLPRSPESPATHRAADRILAHEDGYTSLGLNIEVHRAEDLDQYKRCPRAYLYQRILELSGARDDNAYVRFHRAVYAVLRWMSRIEPEKEVGITDAMVRLDAAWGEIGPAAHPLQSVYRETANRIVERAIARRNASGELIDAEWELKRPGGRIKVRPDHVETGAGGLVVRRLRTGRPPKSKIDDDIYALYHEAATRELGGAQVEALFLTTDEARPVPMTPTVINNRLKKYDEAIAGICAGLFPPIPNERECPRCPQYFICPALPAGLDET
ncbi:MAG: PD-(D/E)XK nuclease family protein, partial [Oricola sp.]|nr:PD-(D/E)XK nuclease family protein [Oricola sp.]